MPLDFATSESLFLEDYEASQQVSRAEDTESKSENSLSANKIDGGPSGRSRPSDYQQESLTRSASDASSNSLNRTGAIVAALISAVLMIVLV